MHMELLRKQQNENIVDIWLDFFIIFGLLIVKIMFHSYFERKNDTVLTFNIVYFS